jgi:hypothetical protein
MTTGEIKYKACRERKREQPLSLSKTLWQTKVSEKTKKRNVPFLIGKFGKLEKMLFFSMLSDFKNGKCFPTFQKHEATHSQMLCFPKIKWKATRNFPKKFGRNALKNNIFSNFPNFPIKNGTYRFFLTFVFGVIFLCHFFVEIISSLAKVNFFIKTIVSDDKFEVGSNRCLCFGGSIMLRKLGYGLCGVCVMVGCCCEVEGAVGMEEDSVEAYSFHERSAVSSSALEVSFPSRVLHLSVLNQEEWIMSFEPIADRVSLLLACGEKHLLAEIGPVAIIFACPTTLQSLCAFCAELPPRHHSRSIVSGLLVLFSRAALELDDSCFADSLSKSLTDLAADVSIGARGSSTESLFNHLLSFASAVMLKFAE